MKGKRALRNMIVAITGAVILSGCAVAFDEFANMVGEKKKFNEYFAVNPCATMPGHPGHDYNYMKKK